MARNSLGREVPTTWRGRTYEPYVDPFSRMPQVDRSTRPLVRRNPGDSKVLPSLRAAIERCGLQSGMTIATHHHLRNGDLLLNLLVKEIGAMGIRDITIASSSIHP
ncbi:MAG: citrate lyase subunit alpha, partial [Acidobacteria bacterium]|nr:citrate lyase subunit alpha [Acidobacteriota bacterium]